MTDSKKKMLRKKAAAKKSIIIALAAAMSVSTVFSGCNSGGNTSSDTSSSNNMSSQSSQASSGSGSALPENGNYSASYTPSDDKYRTFYEIFPYSFYDSDSSGVGDLKGITAKLDYLNDGDASTTTDLGIDGIWLMPIMPSPSYHKYNISDYKSIDQTYGTMEDFEELIEQAHKRGINVIIDFVINHTSKTHEWYKNAIAELKEGKTDGYAQYYHFEENKKAKGWQKTGVGDWYYECEFDSDMPDLNLTNEKVRKELEEIVKFWIDKGVDGFRLDAVMWYEASGNEDSIKDLSWLYSYAKSVKEDVYMIGECWTDFGIVSDYYKSGVDSFFNFDEQGASGDIANAVNKKNALSYVKSIKYYQDKIEANNPDGINAPFISNHDTARSAGFLTSETQKRMAAALYIISPGNPFIYYGEEIGMKGSSNDPEKRTGMYWSADDTTGYVAKIPGSLNKEVPDKAVDEQLKDENSLLSFYKKVIRLRNQNLEIARGDITTIEFDDVSTAGYVSDYDGSKVMVIYNISNKESTVTIPDDKFKVNEVRGYVIADAGDGSGSSGSAKSGLDAMFASSSADESSAESSDSSSGSFSVDGQKVTMPAYSVIVLK